MDSERIAPEDWIDTFNSCDLDLAFKALDGLNHFHTDTLRGRICSLKLLPEEAWYWFKIAEDKYKDFPKNPKNNFRLFYLKVYCYENALVEQSAHPVINEFKTDKYMRDLLSFNNIDAPLANQLSRFFQGIHLIHKEKYESAQKIFKQLIEESKNQIIDEKTAFYLALSVALYNSGKNEEAFRQFENASLYIPTLTYKFNMGLYAGIASAILRFWERHKEADEWMGFLQLLKIPKKTIQIFNERANRILERSLSLQRIFLF